jgi:protein tyrosine/serine phosphatase
LTKNNLSNQEPPKPDRWRLRFFRRTMLIIGLGLLVVCGVAALRFFVFHNFGTVVEGQVYRSNQPTGDDIRRWQTQYGLKSVLNLRGDEKRNARVQSEMAAAKEVGVQYLSVQLGSTSEMTHEDMSRTIEALETAPRPLLIHCRLGADRTGVVSMMAAMAFGGASYQQARRQVTPFYFHFDYAPKHVGSLLGEYETWCRQTGRDTDGWTQFRQWALNVYAKPGTKEKD